MPNDPRIGKTLPVVAPHHGHTVTVIGRDKDKPKAFVIRCECGTEALLGEHWLDRVLERGTLAHGTIAQSGELDAIGLLDRAERQGKDE